MERPPKKYVCEKCGYLGDTSEHEGCDYLAWTTGEQLYIDQLERELALLKASPVGAPEGWKLVPVVPTHAELVKAEENEAIIAAANALENIASTSSSTRIRRVANAALKAIRARRK